MGIFDSMRGNQIKVHVVIKGRIGDAWRDVDTYLRVPQGCTLGKLVDVADSAGIPLREALNDSPHLTDTMMLNGERCPFAENAERTLNNGDEIYLLAPLAGG